MPTGVRRRIIDLEWPSRYMLECGHSVAIAADASVADMAMPGQELDCPACGGATVAAGPEWLVPFKAGEAINAMTLNSRLKQIEARLVAMGLQAQLTPFAPDEPINADTLNRRLEELVKVLGG